MPSTSPRALCALVATLAGLVLVPGSLSAVGGGAASTADPREVAESYLDKQAGTLGVTRADVADLAVTSSYRSAAQRRHPRQPEPALPGSRGLRRARDRQRRDRRQRPLRRREPRPRAGGLAVRDGHGRADGGGRGRGRRAPARDAHRPAGDQPGERPVAGDGRLRGRDLREADPGAAGLAAHGSGLRAGLAARHRRVLGRRALERRSSTPRRAGCSMSEDWTSKDDLDRARDQARAAARGRGLPEPGVDGDHHAEPGHRRLELPGVRVPDGEPERRAADARGTTRPTRPRRRSAGTTPTAPPGTGVHDHARQQRPRLPRPGRQQRDRTSAGPGRRRGPRLRLPGRPDRARAELPRRRGHEPLLRQQRLPRHHAIGFGFDEAAGNFQANNYGRGGTRGRLRPRRGGRRRAARTTPTSPRPSRRATSGGTPRMQMFLWPGNQFGAQNQVVVDGRRLVRRGVVALRCRADRRRHVRPVHQRQQRLRRRRLRRRRRDGSRSSPAATPAARTSTRPGGPARTARSGSCTRRAPAPRRS